jgi:DNA invertase Pin-like site-specific DNA recombinase
MQDQPSARCKRVAQYLRMSTDMQHLSIPLQVQANEAFAAEHHLEIVETYADPAESGLTLDDRPGLRRLIADVAAGGSRFEAILVFDVSRWGRFQDPDEAAHYEFICRQAGARVIYTSEIFQDDDTFSSTLVKHLRRMMAADFSRDLSDKIRRAHVVLHAQGLHSGGPTAYGLSRQQVAPDGRPMKIMEPGERKNFAGCRIVLVPGPPEETAVVRRIFDLFVRQERNSVQIAAVLNARGITKRRGGVWTTTDILDVLRNEAHAGVSVLGKTSFYLNRFRGNVPRDQWRRKPNAIKPVVSHALWRKAQVFLDQRRQRYVSDARLISDLRALHRRHGRLNADIIAAGGGYTVGLYRKRFGSLAEAYVRAGFGLRQSEARASLRTPRPIESYRRNPPISEEELLADLRRVFLRERRLTTRIINAASDCRSALYYTARFGGLRRPYALVGYQPSRFQDLQLDLRGQSISSEEASQLCAAARSAFEAAS